MFSLLSLLDDIASVLDDVAAMTKVAVKDTSALMSDDLAVNTGVVHGVMANQELPMVWRIFVGALLNKVYCIIGVLLFMAIYPPILKVILVIGGIYLSYEGAHKVVEKIFDKEHKGKQERKKISVDEKVKGAVRTDLILSIEIIVIAHSSMAGPLLAQAISLVVVGIIASVLIYGLVGLLVKIDDLGLILVDRGHKKIGLSLVKSMPYMMKFLGIIGTIAMFLVGGGIIVHTFHMPLFTFELLQNLIIGVILGLVAVAVMHLIIRLRTSR